MSGSVVHEQGPVRVKRCRHGTIAYLTTDHYIGRSLDTYGEYSEGEVDLFRHAVRPGQTVLDIGANIGAHTVPLAKLAGAHGRVLAFEPQRIVFQILCANLALNALTHVHAYQNAVGYGEAAVAMPRVDYTSLNNFGGLAPTGAEAGDGEPVTQISVDSLNLDACHFMKIDVEGMENEAVAGAAETIRRTRPLIYTECDRAERAGELIERLLGFDYRLYWHCPLLFAADNFFKVETNVFGTLVSFNLLCLPRERPQNVPNLVEVKAPNDPRPY